MTKSSKFPLLRFLFKFFRFLLTSCMIMLKLFRNIRCPGGFGQDMNIVCHEKYLNLTLKMSNFSEVSSFYRFPCNFCTISERFHGKKGLKCSNMKERAMLYAFLKRTLQLVKLRILHVFYATSVYFLKCFVVRILKTVGIL